MVLVRISIKEILSLINKKGYVPYVCRTNDYVFITVARVIMISIHKNHNIRVSRSSNPSECRCEFIVSEERLIKMLKSLPPILPEQLNLC